MFLKIIIINNSINNTGEDEYYPLLFFSQPESRINNETTCTALR